MEIIYFAYVMGNRVPMPFETMKEADDFMKKNWGSDDYTIKMFREVADD